MPDSQLREWLTLFASGLSALFAGLIWWLARQRLSTRMSATAERQPTTETLALRIDILNRGDRDLKIEALSVDAPLSLLVSEQGSVYGSAAPEAQLNAAKRVQQATYPKQIEPENKGSMGCVVYRKGGFSSCKSVSIRLHILKSFPVIRRSTKQLKATLIPSTVRATSV